MAPKVFDAETAQGLASLAEKLAKNPKHRRAFVEMIEDVEPERKGQFPDIQAQRFQDEVNDRLAKEKADRHKDEINRGMNAARAALLARFGGGTDGEARVKEVEALMEKYGVVDYEIGAKIYAAENPPTRQPGERGEPGSAGVFEFPSIKGGKFQDLLNNPVTAARGEAYRVVDELRSGTRH